MYAYERTYQSKLLEGMHPHVLRRYQDYNHLGQRIGEGALALDNGLPNKAGPRNKLLQKFSGRLDKGVSSLERDDEDPPKRKEPGYRIGEEHEHKRPDDPEFVVLEKGHRFYSSRVEKYPAFKLKAGPERPRKGAKELSQITY